MGSKSKIAEWVVDTLPAGDRLVDLFAGGCAVTHCAMLRGKWKRFLINDICDAPNLFIDAVNGKYRDERRWISRNDFFRLKDTDPYVRYVWSFGNNGRNYLYSRLIEPYMKACHYAIAFDDWTEFNCLCPEVADSVKKVCDNLILNQKKTDMMKGRRLAFGKSLTKKLKDAGEESIIKDNPLYWRIYKNSCAGRKGYEVLESFVNHARLCQIEHLLHNERMNDCIGGTDLSVVVSKADYRNIDINKGDVVYCDIPYNNSAQYYKAPFNRNEFLKWALSRPFPVFVSEYQMPKGFVCIAEKEKQCLLAATANTKVVERIFVQSKFA